MEFLRLRFMLQLRPSPNPQKNRLPPEVGLSFCENQGGRLAAHAHFTIASHNHFRFVAATFPAQCGNFATSYCAAPSHARLLARATCRDANASLVGAATAGILQANNHLHGRWRTGTTTGLFTALSAAMTTVALRMPPVGTSRNDQRTDEGRTQRNFP